MSYNKIVYRPLSAADLAGFPKRTKPRQTSSFSTPWNQTVGLLCREVEHLNNGTHGHLVVVQLNIPEASIRQDGTIVKGRDAHGPHVAVSFPSIHGPLRYQTDEFESPAYRAGPDWQHNVRAIALALEALRKVDRYGVAGRGEQYTGWAQLGTGRPMGASPDRLTEAEALAILAGGSGMALGTRSSREDVVLAFKKCAAILHPDVPGGDTEKFKRLVAARDLLVGRT